MSGKNQKKVTVLIGAAMGLVIGLVLFFLLKRSKVLDKLALQ